MVYIVEEIIPNPPFQSPGQLLVILSVSSNMDFGDTREVSLIDTQCISSDNSSECLMKI